MEFERTVKMMEKKLSEGQVIVDVLPAYVYAGSSQKRYEDQVVVTNKAIYFYLSNNLKKTILVAAIDCITLSILGKEMVLHSQNDDVRIEAQNISIIKNILQIRQKILKQTNGMRVYLQLSKNLQNFIQKSTKTSFFKSLFSPKKQEVLVKKSQPRNSKGSERNSEASQRSSFSKDRSNRNSYSIVQVKEKDFVFLIGKKMYQAVYRSAQLLYVSGNLGFIFNDQDYNKQILNEQVTIYSRVVEKEVQTIRLSKISKTGNSSAQNAKIRKYLEGTKIADFQQQILFAVETEKQFQVLSPVNRTMISLEQMLQNQILVSEKDIKSIFYKLASLVQDNPQVLCSLSPSRISMNKEDIHICSVLCILEAENNPKYMSPEQMVSLSIEKDTIAQTEGSEQQIGIVKAVAVVQSTIERRRLGRKQIQVQLINLWKIGLLLYQIAYFCLPFPIEYLASSITNRSRLTIYFPQQSSRSFQLQQFLLFMLRQSPQKRGGGSEWKTQVFKHEWITKVIK